MWVVVEMEHGYIIEVYGVFNSVDDAVEFTKGLSGENCSHYIVKVKNVGE